MGPTFPPKREASLLALEYKECTFFFCEQETLCKVVMSRSPTEISPHVRVTLDQGVEIDQSEVLLGCHKLEALRVLGNPNKEYFKGE